MKSLLTIAYLDCPESRRPVIPCSDASEDDLLSHIARYRFMNAKEQNPVRRWHIVFIDKSSEIRVVGNESPVLARGLFQ